MKYSIRDLFLLTLTVALAAGWYVDHRRAATKQAKWEALFDDAMSSHSVKSPQERFYDTPAVPVTVNRKPDPENAITMPLMRQSDRIRLHLGPYRTPR